MNNHSNTEFNMVMIDDTYIDLGASSNQSYKTIPVHLRERDEGLVHVNTYCSVIDDPACMPEAGGMMGVRNLAEIFGVSVQQLKRYILPKFDFVRYYGGIPVTNVSSAYAARDLYHTQVNQARCERLGVNYTNCS
jgi:hypothetical protein